MKSTYEGVQAQMAPAWPVLCICHILGLPGTPATARQHPNYKQGELEAGNLSMGARREEAQKNHLVETAATTAESNVWLVLPQEDLAEGAYA
jgi:hypothetical protein